MSEETVDYIDESAAKRPTFLTVLCILTWVVATYYVLTVPFSYFFSSAVDQSTFQTMMNEAMSSMDEQDPAAAEMVEGFMSAASETVSKQLENAGWIALTEMITALLSAFGAFLMWKLRKTGFWIYMMAKIIGLLSIALFLGVNMLTVMAMSFVFFIGLIFVIMYAVNLKYMT